MMGHHFGVPFHRGLQRRVILECLALVADAKESGEIRALDVTWADARREGREIERLLAERG